MEGLVHSWVWGTPLTSWPGALALLLATTLLSLGLWGQRALPPARRALAGGLALAASLVLAAAVLRPSRIEREQVPRPPLALVIVDDSLSMSLPTPGGGSRAEVARAAARLLVERLPGARVVDLAGAPLDLDAPPAAARDASPLLDTLARVRAPGSGSGADLVALVSDLQERGSPSDTAERERALHLLRARAGTPVLAIDVGTDSSGPDLSVQAIRHDTVAFRKNVTSAAVQVTARDLPHTRVEVSFGVNGAWTGAQVLDLDPARGGTAEAVFRYRPDEVGQVVLAARVRALDALDEANTANNLRLSSQSVLRDRLRVLHLAGHPSWDVRFLREALRADGAVDLISFYVMVRASSFYLEDLENTALIPFPTQTLFEEELGGFDLLVLQNFRFGTFETDRYAERLVRYVREGGAVLIIGGEQAFLSDALAGSAFREVLPVRLPAYRTYRDYVTPGAYRPEPTALGLRHPLLRAAFGRDVRGALTTLPNLDGANVTDCPQPGALVLLEHPRARTPCGPQPLLALQELGAGRAALLGTDSLWRWAFRPEAEEPARPHRVLVDALVRWLIGDPSALPFDVRVDVVPDDPGARVVRARLHEGEDRDAQTWALRVQAWGDTEAQGTRVLRAEEPAFPWRPEHDGLYWLEVERRDEGGTLRRRVPVLVQGAPDELIEPSPGRAALTEALLAGGGRVLAPADLPDLRPGPAAATALLRSQVVEPLDTPWTLAWLIALLVGLWLLREPPRALAGDDDDAPPPAGEPSP